MASIDEIREVRLKKKALLEEKGISAYPSVTNRTHTLAEAKENFETLEKAKETITVVGRIMSLRGQGALMFVDLYDGTDKMQALMKQDNEISYAGNDEENGFELFSEVVDESDYIEVSGELFVTNRGAQTIEVKSWRMLSKNLRPVPDEFYGVKDEDERYRKRYLDILLNEEVRKTIERRSVFWNTIRQFLLEKSFVEVQTPVLENTPGGAEARPFVTHHNALDIDVYLRISCGELWQKKLLVAGMPRVFEIGRIFRNEGMSNEHLQDYTQVEFYQAYSDYREGMEMVKELYRTVAEKTFGTTEFEIGGQKVDLNNEWETYDFVQIIEDKFNIDVLDADEKDLIATLEENSIKFDPKEINRERAADLLWKVCRKEIVGPGFLINVPVFLEPLAKKNIADPRVVERFQVILGGTELGKGFSELNDPVDQASRFDHQEGLRASGDDEAQMKDDEYVEAMEYGMPPAFGFGTSERLFAVLNGTSVREAQIFPMMRPKE